ncbi:DUF6207 family protein [Streptomyces sp. NPDC003753]
MKPIRGQHIAEPGLVVAFAFQEALAGRWATATDDRTTRTPGEPGVRLRCARPASGASRRGRPDHGSDHGVGLMAGQGPCPTAVRALHRRPCGYGVPGPGA